ncbi:protein-disulfide reductase DsbD family protein [Malikia granosa]|uniref:Protein-disulfide reductase n=1 Tax=Malikia granosa TaxID=263067 RepID=A0A2S9K877_9BURK|nr:thioredoxin family protein [Malikia granosa]PRD66602.1 protein-disulfide reductase [Malikia granosa]
MRHWIARLLFALLCTLSWPSWALDLTGGGIVKTEQVRAELLVHAPEGVTAGKPLWLGLQLQHTPHWHSYWKNAGDSGLPTELRWTLPAGVTAGEIAWPTPRKFPLGELANYGYDGTVLLPVPLQVGPEFQGEALVVKLQANWLVCRQECIPEEGHFQLRIPSQGSTAQHASLFQQAWDAAPRAQAAASSRLQPDEKSLQVSLDGLPAAWRGQSLEIFPETAGLIAPGAPWTQAWNGAQWSARLPLSPERSEGPSQVALVVALAGKAESPAGVRMEVPVQGKWPAAAARSEIPEALKQALAQAPQDTSASSNSATTGRIGLWAALLGALAGGLILNLMPCVFPVLAIKVIAFARHADDRRAHRRAGLAYTAGVLLSFLALGGLLLLLRAAGEQLGWGFQLQNPAVVAGLALLFTVIGLNLAGLFDFGRLLPASLAGLQLRHPLADAFLTGVLAVAVASPCTAPFMGASLGLAIGLPAAQALSVFAAIGIGMALPYLAASFFPWVAHALPRPGAWMETLRQFMAFPMLATVVWLLWVLGQQTGIDGAATLLLALLLLAWLAWAISRRGKTRRWLAPLLLAGLLGWLWQAGGRIWTPLNEPAQATTASALPTADRNWHGWTPERLAQLQTSGQPVLVDYTAAWCVTCQYNKGTVLADRDLLAHLADAGVVLLRADWTRRDPAVTQALAAIGRNGVPTYALYLPGQAPRLLSELPSRAEVIEALGRR